MIHTNYFNLTRNVWFDGEYMPSRFGNTREIGDGTTLFKFYAGDIPDRPKMALQVCWVELMQLIAGTFDRTLFKRKCPGAKQSLFTKEMAYGPRTWEQLPRIIEELRSNPNTREAILYVGRDYQTCTPHEPCTNSLQFLLRDGKLRTVASMRSLDVLKGLPPDMVMFGGLAQAVARCVNAEASTVVIHPGSAHIYTADVDAGKLPMRPVGRQRSFTMPLLESHAKDLPSWPCEWSDYVEWSLLQCEGTLWDRRPEGIFLRQDGELVPR